MKRSLYLYGGGTLSRQQNTLQFKNQTPTTRFVPVENISDIHALGQITINSHLLTFLSDNDIPLHVYSHNGHYAGSYMPRLQKGSGNTTLAQASHYNDETKRLELPAALSVEPLKISWWF